MKSNRIYWIWNYLDVMWIRLKIYFDEHLAKYMPRIPRKKPKAPVCEYCFAKTLKTIPMKLKAYQDSDGWDIFWECEECSDNQGLDVLWFPFVFNWANAKDMERIGIEVV